MQYVIWSSKSCEAITVGHSLVLQMVKLKLRFLARWPGSAAPHSQSLGLGWNLPLFPLHNTTIRDKSTVRPFFKKRFYLFIFRERGREGERERNINVWLPLVLPRTGDLARNPGMCPDWESNWWPFGSQAHTQSTELYQPGPIFNSVENWWVKNYSVEFKFLRSLAGFPFWK